MPSADTIDILVKGHIPNLPSPDNVLASHSEFVSRDILMKPNYNLLHLT